MEGPRFDSATRQRDAAMLLRSFVHQQSNKTEQHRQHCVVYHPAFKQLRIRHFYKILMHKHHIKYKQLRIRHFYKHHVKNKPFPALKRPYQMWHRTLPTLILPIGSDSGKVFPSLIFIWVASSCDCQVNRPNMVNRVSFPNVAKLEKNEIWGVCGYSRQFPNSKYFF